MKPLARHCGGRRMKRSGAIVVVHGGKCRSSRGLCGCPCAACQRATTCKHAHTHLSMLSIIPTGIRFEPVACVRSERADGTAYVGPGVRVFADPDPPPAKHKTRYTCIDCGRTLRSSNLPP